MTVYFATRIRGFFKHLFNSNELLFKINSSHATQYETNSRLHNILVKLIRSRLCDILGIIQVINLPKVQASVVGSYNRFINSNVPYFIYLENPVALYHYSLNRSKTYFGRKKLNSQLNNPNLKAVVCMCKATLNTFDLVIDPPSNSKFKLLQIYPLVPKNKYINHNVIENKKSKKIITFLYIAQGIRFQSKGGLEVLKAFIRLADPNTKLIMVTNINYINQDIKDEIAQYDNILLRDFNLTYDEMEQLYASSDVLLQPTSDDSCSLTILEALHAGLPIIASKLFSIPEIVSDGINGFLVEPHYWFFDKNNLPNPEVWNHRDETIYSGNISTQLISDIECKMRLLTNDKNLLIKMSHASLDKSYNPPFNESYIVSQWNNLISSIS